jgi:site-specific DNA-methyltransferase (adenine-specific)
MEYINKILYGDSQLWLKKIPDNYIDMTLTSPPYDNLRTYNGIDWNEEIFKNIANELYRITKIGGVVVWVVGDAVIDGSETGTSFRQALYFKEIGFNLHDTMIFEKNCSPFPASRTSNRYTQIFEYMFVLSKGKPKTHNLICDKENRFAGQTNYGIHTHRTKDDELIETDKIKPVPKYSARNNIWRYKVNYGYISKDKEAHEHPAIFPESLAEDHIRSWTNEGDLVLDVFSGSGTTIKMSHLLRRNFIGIDINNSYINIIKKRMEKLGHQIEVLTLDE